MIPNFQATMHRMISIRDTSLNNPHALFIGDTDTLAEAAGAILQADGTNPRIEKRDRNLIEPLIGDSGPGQSLLLNTEFYAVRISLDDKDIGDFRKSDTFWIRFNGQTRLTQGKWIYDETTPDETSLTIYLEIQERF